MTKLRWYGIYFHGHYKHGLSHKECTGIIWHSDIQTLEAYMGILFVHPLDVPMSQWEAINKGHMQNRLSSAVLADLSLIYCVTGVRLLGVYVLWCC